MAPANFRRWRRILVWSIFTAFAIFLLDFFYTTNMVAI